MELKFIESCEPSEVMLWVAETCADEYIDDHSAEWARFCKAKEAQKWCHLKYDVSPNQFVCERCNYSMEIDMPMSFIKLDKLTNDFCKAHMNCTPEDKLIGRVNEVNV